MFKKLLATVALLLLLPLAGQAQTAGSFINQLPVGATPTGAELFPVWQSNATKRLTVNQLNLGLFLPVVNGDCIVGSGGAWVAGSCAAPSGSVNAGTAGQLGYYATSSNVISGTNALPNGTTATTQTAGDSSTKPATTAFVNGTALTLTNGTTATTQAISDNSTNVATTAFVKSYTNGTALTLTNGTTATTQAANDNSTNVATTAYADRASVFTKSYASSQQTISSAGTLNLSHGMGVVPKFVTFTLVCQSNDGGFTSGDIVPTYITSAALGASALGGSVTLTSSTIHVTFSSQTHVFQIPNLSTGAGGDLDNTKWKLIVSAYY